MKKGNFNKEVQLLKSAIENRRLVIFSYDSLQRIVEPYQIGVLGNEIQLHSFQIAGESNSGNTPQWRNFSLARIKKLKVQDIEFGLRLSYHPENSNFQEIFYSVYD